MADPHHRRKKRSRVENQNLDALPSFKKIHVDLTDLAPSSNDSNSPIDRAGGVFDFPWMKEGAGTGMIKFDDDDAFASSSLNVSELFGPEADDHRLVMTGLERAADGRYDSVMCRKKEDVKGDEEDGLECVWDSLLNQKPLSNIEFEAGGF